MLNNLNFTRKKSFLFAIIFVLILVIVLQFIAFYRLKSQLSKIQTGLLNKNVEISRKDKEIDLLYKNGSETLVTYSEPYSFESFGVYSKLFESKKVEVNEILYKRSKIIQKSIDLTNSLTDEQKKAVNTLGVIIWQYPNNSLHYIIQGYENYFGVPTMVNEITDGWTVNDSYQTTYYGIMHWYYHYSPKHIGVVSLETYQQNSPKGWPYFIMLSATPTEFVYNTTDENLNPAKQVLEELANTLSDRTQ